MLDCSSDYCWESLSVGRDQSVTYEGRKFSSENMFEFNGYMPVLANPVSN